MNRTEAIIAGIVGTTTAMAVVLTAVAESSRGANADLDQIRTYS